MKVLVYLIACVLLFAGCNQVSRKSVSPATASFRSDWKDGQRARVTEDLVAVLEVGMTREQVVSILERP